MAEVIAFLGAIIIALLGWIAKQRGDLQKAARQGLEEVRKIEREAADATERAREENRNRPPHDGDDFGDPRLRGK